MAKHFKEDEIEKFRESFFFNARECKKERNKVPALLNVDELEGTLMSLGLVPTLYELRNYLQQYKGRVTFADFLDLIYKQKQTEQIPEDILEGFKAQDWRQKGRIPVDEVRFLLRHFGHGISDQEVNQIFSEGGVTRNDKFITYEDFVQKFVASCQREEQRNDYNVKQNRPAPADVSRGYTPGNYHEPMPDY